MSVPLILASASPRRRKLLTEAGYKFEAVGPVVAELAGNDFSLREMTTANATRKALVVSRIHENAIVLGADTLVFLDGEVIGKPANYDDAREILRRLSGRTHEVCTAVFIRGAEQFVSFTEISQVRFRWLSASDIEAYLTEVNPLDKAGAYAAQRDSHEIIASIKGSTSNVIGLPMERTAEALRHFHILPRR